MNPGENEKNGYSFCFLILYIPVPVFNFCKCRISVGALFIRFTSKGGRSVTTAQVHEYTGCQRSSGKGKFTGYVHGKIFWVSKTDWQIRYR